MRTRILDEARQGEVFVSARHAAGSCVEPGRIVVGVVVCFWTDMSALALLYVIGA